MAGKDKRVRTIDAEKGVVGAGQVVTAAPPSVGPAVPTLPPPTGLQVDSNTLMLSAQVPKALVNISWRPPLAQEQRQYEVQIALDSGFTTGVETFRAGQTSAGLQLTTDADGILYYIRVRAISGPVVSAWSSSISVTTAGDTTPPAQPTGLAYTWDGTDLVLTWTPPVTQALKDVEVRIWASNGGTLFHTDYSSTGRFVWTLAMQRQETSNNLDDAVYVELRSRNWANVVNTTSPPSISPTNADPSAPASVSIISAPGILLVTVTATQPQDFAVYRYRLIQTLPSASDITWDDPSAVVTRAMSVAATYQVGVRIVDVYGNVSTETLSSASAFDQLTVAELRAEAIYSDSEGGAAATLKAALADQVLGSGGITYTSNAGWVRWIRVERPLLDRYRFASLSMIALAGSTSWYVRLSADNSTWRYFAGPVTGRVLTEVASAAAAQAAAVAATTLGNSSAPKIELPATVEARFVEVWLRNTTGSTRVDEWYPWRLVEADAIRAQTLSAISADLGTITAGIVTGATIQTAASGARIELTSANGLRSFNSGGTVQAQIRTTDGVMVAGGGQVLLSSSGVELRATDAGDAGTISIRNDADSAQLGFLSSSLSAPGEYEINLINAANLNTSGIASAGIALARSATNGVVTLDAKASSGTLVRFRLSSSGNNAQLSGDGFTVGSTSSAAAALDVYRGTLSSGTAAFRGTTYNSHFNYSTAEDTFIRAGKANATVYIQDNTGGETRIGSSGGSIPSDGTTKLRAHNATAIGNSAGNSNLVASVSGANSGNVVGIGFRNYRQSAGSDWTGVSMLLQRFTDTTYQTPYLNFDPNGRLGLNVLTPSYELQISTDSAGKPGTTTWTVVSDERTKDPVSVRPYTDGLALLRRLPRPTYFRYNGQAETPTEREHVGFMAQDIAAVADRWVRRVRGRLRPDDVEETEILGLGHMDELIYTLLNAVLELDSDVRRLQTARA